jgi:hypothetical protein
MNDTKVCRVCGRRFGWRKKWAATWEQVRYCSEGCRKRGLKPLDQRLETELLALLGERGDHKTICPSQLARRLEPDEAAWRALMEPIRMAARRLHHRGRLEIVQGGRLVDPDSARGPLRLRRKRAASNPSGKR